ncbi:hypothetical protein G7Y89_g10716 [Cudoniella acicularis]|uniref:Uncharacterized protein n=1 Tax=Cudoniella acicularis TaxID=354080 RepID=A0A8H4RDR2_9HELO|nr:hypothetical protein G7Y89_g10716 [Cudoniella acicularis]
MKFNALIVALPFLANSCFAIPHSKRADLTDVTLYAYGTNISGLPVYFGNSDGLAYITSNTTAPTTLSSITWDIPSSSDQSWNVATLNSTTAGTFYIIEDGFNAAGFITSNTTVTNSTTTGFSLFGGQVVTTEGDVLEAQFWAKTTDTDGVWSLMWNEDGTTQDDSTPVVLKRIAPAATG